MPDMSILASEPTEAAQGGAQGELHFLRRLPDAALFQDFAIHAP
jgi:hypothetical protein